MTIAAIKAIMAKHNARSVIAIGFDNDKSVYTQMMIFYQIKC